MKHLLVIVAVGVSVIAGIHIHSAYSENAAWEAGSFRRNIDNLDRINRGLKELK